MLVKRSMFCVPSYFLCFSVFAMVKRSIRLRAEKTGNPVFPNLVPLLVGNVGPICTKGDLKEVDEEVAKYKVGAPARTGLVAHIDVIVPPGNTGLNLAHTRASVKPISPTFSRVSIKMTLHYQPIKEVALGNTPIIAFCDTDSPMQCVALLLRDHAAAAIARDSAAIFAWKGKILQELFSRHRGPGAVHQARRIHDPGHCRREEVAVGAGARRGGGNKLGGR